MSSTRQAALLAALMVSSAPASAGPPSLVPVQGFLTDAGGAPLDGTFDVTLYVYTVESGGSPVYTEARSLTVDRGAFTVYLGEGGTLDLQIFDAGQAWLGIKVGPDAEMAPRLRFATVPYSAYATQADVAATVLPSGNGVPSGAVMFFDLASCPSGWSAFTGARGRTLVGVPSGGTLGAQVGIPLADQENRSHAHSVDVGSTASASGGDHSHDVNPAAVASASGGGSHAHSVAPPPVATDQIIHAHVWSTFDSTNAWKSYNSEGMLLSIIEWSDGMDTAGIGTYPLARPATSAVQTHYTARNTHSHRVDAVAFDSANVDTSHSHSVDVANTTSASGGVHGHAVDPAAVSSSSAAGILPYVQFLACRKD